MYRSGAQKKGRGWKSYVLRNHQHMEGNRRPEHGLDKLGQEKRVKQREERLEKILKEL